MTEQLLLFAIGIAANVLIVVTMDQPYAIWVCVFGGAISGACIAELLMGPDKGGEDV